LRFFQIEYDEWVNIVYIFGKELHQPYSDVCSMPFYDITMVLDKFEEDVKKQNEESEAQSKSMSSQQRDMRRMTDDMSKQFNTQQPQFKMPEMPKMEMPKFNF